MSKDREETEATGEKLTHNGGFKLSHHGQLTRKTLLQWIKWFMNGRSDWASRRQTRNLREENLCYKGENGVQLRNLARWQRKPVGVSCEVPVPKLD